MLSDDDALDLALAIPLEWTEDDRVLLAGLIDGTVVWLEDDELDAIARPLVEVLWPDELREDIERALALAAETSDYIARRLGEARADLDCGPTTSRLALAVVRQAAIDLTGSDLQPGCCLLCVEDGLGLTPRAAHVQRVVKTAAAIAARADPTFGDGAPSDEARVRARERIRELARMAEQSLPRLSHALLELAEAPLPPADDDELWRAAVAERRAAIAAWN